MSWLASARARWFTLAALWATLLVLGIGGFLQQASDGGYERSFLDTLYLTVQLATLEYGAGDDVLNWRLQVARFVAPIMAAGTVLQTASLVFAEQFRRFRLRFVSGHTIICGLGDTGGRLAVAFAEAGRTVVAIDADPAAAGVEAGRAAGVTVLTGDAAAVELLRIARVDRAAQVVAVSGDDAKNVEIALTTATVERRSRSALRVAVHLTDAELAALLRAADLDARSDVRVSFFNLHERAASALIAENPPFDAPDAHVVVMGLGQLGRSLVVAIAQAWVGRGSTDAVAVTVIDRAASGRWEALRMQHPGLDSVCATSVVDLDLDQPGATSVAALRQRFLDCPPTWVAVAFEDESVAMSSALFLQQGLVPATTPIVVRTRTASGLGALLAPAAGAVNAHTSVGVFPFLDRTCTVAAIEGGAREQLARAVHEQYLADASAHAVPSALAKPWDELDDDQRDPSRRRVDGVLADLDAVGCTIAPLRHWGAPVLSFDDADIDRLAQREHQRWFDERVAAGWSHGATRDNAAKRNPLLVEWSALPADAQQMNRAAAAALPTMLARAGFEPVQRPRNAAII